MGVAQHTSMLVSPEQLAITVCAAADTEAEMRRWLHGIQYETAFQVRLTIFFKAAEAAAAAGPAN